MNSNKRQTIKKIENGLAIDHLDFGSAWKIAELLKLRKYEGRVSLGDGYDSAKLPDGKKGFLKIEGRELTPYEVNLIALVAPNATVNYIKGGNVVRKMQVEIPSVLEGIVDCVNSGCVSNKEGEKFSSLINYSKGVFSCHYCKGDFSRKDIKI